MTFFRIKKIKGKEYAYLVENEWNRKGSRQRVMEYLGRAYRFNSTNTADFSEFIKNNETEKYMQNSDINKIIRDLIKWELFKFGVNAQVFNIDLGNKTIRKGGKNIVLVLNDGFMCNLTLKNLLEFKPEINEEDGSYRLARAFVEAGIKVSQDIFIELFAKLYKIDTANHKN